MYPKRRVLFLIVTIIIVVIVLITNYHFVSVLNRTQGGIKGIKRVSVQEKIMKKLPLVMERYKNKQSVVDKSTDIFIYNLNKIEIINSIEHLWKEAKSWVSKTQLYNLTSPLLGTVLHYLKTSKIIKADIDTRGTQLKLFLTLEGGQQAVFKPKWYPINKVIEGPVYAGKDRYFSEIIAFYLSAILKKPLAPLATQRDLSLTQEIIPVATERLLKTIFDRDGVKCVYGKCFYCKPNEPVCEDFKGKITGALIYNVDSTFNTYRSPWQRTYSKEKRALWEINTIYCKNVKEKLPQERLLNLIDTAIFDFLIQNGDRHHYETLDDTVVLIDNGKGLGNPFINYIDILAPLYQCCILKTATLKRLEQLSGGTLKEKLMSMPNINKLLTVDHLNSFERRLMIVFAAIEYCKTRNKIETISAGN